jgi:hypothetical protein
MCMPEPRHTRTQPAPRTDLLFRGLARCVSGARLRYTAKVRGHEWREPNAVDVTTGAAGRYEGVVSLCSTGRTRSRRRREVDLYPRWHPAWAIALAANRVARCLLANLAKNWGGTLSKGAEVVLTTAETDFVCGSAALRRRYRERRLSPEVSVHCSSISSSERRIVWRAASSIRMPRQPNSSVAFWIIARRGAGSPKAPALNTHLHPACSAQCYASHARIQAHCSH